VCIGRLDHAAVYIYDSGGTYYGGLICDQLPALPYMGISTEFSDGLERIKLEGVAAGSPADKAGLRPRDALIAIDGESAISIDFRVLLARHAPGDKVIVTILRGDESLDFTLTLGKRS
jgi:carboxyl-terminal processing protease